ncbi:hypothetical protein NPIL_10861 [Nephila pilipes]|uniref:Uncharacterized protein n=1 Tax=Nephila pilipes TaxID=299642 RepID=A0A8X6TVW7_NEPPI|nr:hypothetical protein NPIL_10861 [Nephila pilipes]
MKEEALLIYTLVYISAYNKVFLMKLGHKLDTLSYESRPLTFIMQLQKKNGLRIKLESSDVTVESSILVLILLNNIRVGNLISSYVSGDVKSQLRRKEGC